MTNDEIRMTKPATAQLRVFDIRVSDFFRHSSFDIQRLMQIRFMVPMHAEKTKGAFHEPARPSNRSLPWDSGAEDAALQTLRDCRAFPNRAKRLECVRFIGAFRPARDGPQFMVPMHAKHRTSNIQVAPGWDTAPYREMI